MIPDVTRARWKDTGTAEAGARLSRRYLTRAAAILLGGTLSLASCGEPKMNEQSADGWLDSPAVTRVAFHPRREWGGGGAGAAGYDSVDIPVDEGVTLGARFYAAGRGVRFGRHPRR
jgi:hypothetical protein